MVVSKRISDISSSKERYDQNISYYKDALKHSGFDKISLPYSLTKEQEQDEIKKEKRKNKIIWLNPPYLMNIKMIVGNTFLKLLQHHSPKQHPMH